METTVKSSAINYGLYLGGLLSASTVLAYAFSLDLFGEIWFGLGLMIATIVFGIVSVSKSRAMLDGIISFKEAFTSFFITIAIGVILSSITFILIFNFVDPEAADTVKNIIIKSQERMMRFLGAPAEVIAEAIDKVEAEENMFSLGNNIQQLVISLAGYSVVGLITALIMKRSEENTY